MFRGAAAFPLHNFRLNIRRGIVKLHGNKALAGAVLQVFQRALVMGIVGNAQQEPVIGLDNLPGLFHRQDAPVVGQGVNQHGGILARFHHFVQIQDGPGFDGPGHRPVNPAGAFGIQQIAADQVAGGQILMAGDRNQGNADFALPQFLSRPAAARRPHHRHGAAQLPGHILHKAGLAAAGRAFQQHRNVLVIGGGKEFQFVADGPVVRLAADQKLLDGVLFVFGFSGVAGSYHYVPSILPLTRLAHSSLTVAARVSREPALRITAAARAARSAAGI